ncbi:MAG: hypothetical protein HDQ87_05880 [Clostridia bacterium]|nr:hypothetical protein [Clostridia bacterium]
MTKLRAWILALMSMVLLVGTGSIVHAGNNPPTTQGTLPYYTSKTSINSFVYTNTKWAPSSSGEIYVSVSYDTNNGAATNFYARLFWGSEPANTRLVGTGSSVRKGTVRFYNLSTNKIYSVKFTTTNPTTFRAGCGKTAASAQDFTF